MCCEGRLRRDHLAFGALFLSFSFSFVCSFLFSFLHSFPPSVCGVVISLVRKYRIWNPAKLNQVLISRDVRFPPLEPGEDGVTLELGTATSGEESTSTTKENFETSEHPEPPAVDTNSELSDVPEEPQLRRSARERRAPQRYGARHA